MSTPVCEHDCEDLAIEKLATPDNPYHYLNSGLPNVYLAGVKYRVCKECGQQEADIPALRQLLEAIARTILEKPSPLTGTEVRFLRKRLGRKQKDFADLLSLTPERLSTVENSPLAGMEEVREKFLRTIYPILSGDAKLKHHMLNSGDDFERWMASIQGAGRSEKIIAKWRNRHWQVAAA